jgi:hypothetical protein
VQLAAEDEEGFSVHNELGGCAAGLKMRRSRLLRGEWGLEAGKEQKNWKRGELDSHIDRESTTGVVRGLVVLVSSDSTLRFNWELVASCLASTFIAGDERVAVMSGDGRSLS